PLGTYFLVPRCHHTAEADVRHARVRAAAMPGAGAVPRAVVVVAKERPAALDALGCERTGRIRAALRSSRIHHEPAARTLAVEVPLIPVSPPFPDVAGHIIQAVSVGWKRPERRSSGEAVVSGIPVGELALPDVGDRAGGVRPVIAPHVRL